MTSFKWRKTVSTIEAECTKCRRVLPAQQFHKHKSCKNGINSVCKDCRKPLSKANYRKTTPEYRLWCSAKQRAKQKKLEFSLKISDIVIPEICPVFKSPIKRPSIDRVDNSRGYTVDNIRVISYRANAIKNNASIKEVEDVLMYMKQNLCEIN